MVFLVVLGCLLPLAAYCILLASLNRRPHPALVPGTWDFVGILFGTSGFLLIAGPFILRTFYRRWQEYMLLHRPPYSWTALSAHARYSPWGAYAALLIAGSAITLWRGRRVTAIYNVEPALFDELLWQTLQQSSRDWRRSAAGFVHQGDEPVTELRVAQFPAMRHVTLTWTPTRPPARRDVESRLGAAFVGVWTRQNPAGRWFLGVSMALLAAATAALALLAFSQVMVRAGRP